MSAPPTEPSSPAAPSRSRARLVVRADGAARRRVPAWLVAFAALAALAWRTTPGDGPASVALGMLVAAAGAATLASYVPAHGLRPVLGCTPCAVAAVGSVPVALGLLASGAAGVAVVVALAGLGQRLRTAGASCAA